MRLTSHPPLLHHESIDGERPDQDQVLEITSFQEIRRGTVKLFSTPEHFYFFMSPSDHRLQSPFLNGASSLDQDVWRQRRRRPAPTPGGSCRAIRFPIRFLFPHMYLFLFCNNFTSAQIKPRCNSEIGTINMSIK
jgi:hypothetical protein